MNNFGKKIVGLLFVCFLLFGRTTFANAEKIGELCKSTPTGGAKGERYGTPTNDNVDIGICKCPDGSKWMPDGTAGNDAKGCLSCSVEGVCCGIQLNTDVPFIGNCIEFSKNEVVDPENPGDPNESKVNETTAFPLLMGGLTKILVTIIILMGFVGILAGGVMISASGGDDTKASEGRKLIGRVVIALALLGASGVILRLINPNFFG